MSFACFSFYICWFVPWFVMIRICNSILSRIMSTCKVVESHYIEYQLNITCIPCKENAKFPFFLWIFSIYTSQWFSILLTLVSSKLEENKYNFEWIFQCSSFLSDYFLALFKCLLVGDFRATLLRIFTQTNKICIIFFSDEVVKKHLL